MTTPIHKSDFYDRTYEQPNYFRYKSWLYDPYISSLVEFCGLKKGASVLDVGCGQGLFSYLFGKNGMRAHGIDVSASGIRTAKELYGHLQISFTISDIESAAFSEQFDCIFVRSCSLYNTAQFPWERNTTNSLLSHLKPGGIFIFVYNTNFSSKVSRTWRYHSLKAVQEHFCTYPNAKVLFLNKYTTYLLRTQSFTPFVTRCNALLSRTFGIGGDAICILQKNSNFIE